MNNAPRYGGLTPRSGRASAAARGSSRKVGTKPELLLRRALWEKGYRYRKNRGDLPGSPDIVFPSARVIVFVDGDFWHGKNWKARQAKLKRGHNAEYWIRKIEANIARDLERTCDLRAAGWIVLRVWESDISTNIDTVIQCVESALLYGLSTRCHRKAGHRNVQVVAQACGSDSEVSA
jgi:DNA mismatch endonuclease (patch repair protein)